MTAVREEILFRWVLAPRSLSMLALLSVHPRNRRSTLFVFNQIIIQYPFIKLHWAHIGLLYTWIRDNYLKLLSNLGPTFAASHQFQWYHSYNVWDYLNLSGKLCYWCTITLFFRKEIKKAAIIMMDVDGDLSVCNQCGFPLYDAVMASHTKYSCCSADINNFDFWWVRGER